MAAVATRIVRGACQLDCPDTCAMHYEGRSAQATTFEELTDAGRAPIFNDNRVEVEPLER
jgi:hypothetical protein